MAVKRNSGLAVFCIACFAMACGASQKEPEPPAKAIEAEVAPPSLEESRVKVERISALYTALGDGVDGAAADCDGVATSIRAWSSGNRDEILRLSAELRAIPADQVKQLSPILESSMRRAALQIKDGSDRCPGHEGVFDAISGLPR